MKLTLLSVAATLLANCLASPVPVQAGFGSSSIDHGRRVALLRAYSPEATDHFYTTDADEMRNAVTNLGYSAEGTTGYVFSNKGHHTVPLYRLYSPSATDHFYTTSAGERDNAVNNLGYSNEGTAGYVFPEQWHGSQPLYRLYSSGAQDHFYTLSADERDNAANNLGYTYEGVAAYILPPKHDNWFSKSWMTMSEIWHRYNGRYSPFCT